MFSRVTHKHTLYHTSILALKYTPLYLFPHFHLTVINQQAQGCMAGTTIEAQPGPSALQQNLNLILVLGVTFGGSKKTGFLCPEGPLMKHTVHCNKSQNIDLQLVLLRELSQPWLTLLQANSVPNFTYAHKRTHSMSTRAHIRLKKTVYLSR